MLTFHPLSEITRRHLLAADVDPDAVAAVVRLAVAEDLAGGIDITSTATVPLDRRSVGTFGARRAGTVAGLAVAAAVVETVCGAEHVVFEHLVADGDRVAAGDRIARVEGPTRPLLTAERSALNLLCRLSGIATLTRRWTDAVRDTGARVRDTRKTTPGLRFLEKYAVRCGGGVNHRMALSDAVLVKDNHVLAAGGLADAVRSVRSLERDVPIQIEVDSVDDLAEALQAGAGSVLLDNFSVEDLHRAVAIRDDHRRRSGNVVVLEASGGLTVDTAAQVAATGVDFIAVGQLTHSAPALDIGLDLH